MEKLKQIVAALVLSLLTALAYNPVVLAAQSQSTNYGVSEVQFGSGGELHACSTSYCAKQSAGELTVGNTKSTNYQAQGGLNTEREPLLAVTVTGGTVALGDLVPTGTASGTKAFTVESYLASGYTVSIDGTSPRNKEGHVLAPMASADISRTGVEQFGINLRANTTPVVGVDVVQVPSGTFSFGAPTAAYNTVNTYKYVPGDIIASSTSSSGETDYTMSVIANIATTTNSGAYGGRLVLNVIPTF